MGAECAQEAAEQMNQVPRALFTENLLLSKCFVIFQYFKICLGEEKKVSVCGTNGICN